MRSFIYHIQSSIQDDTAKIRTYVHRAYGVNQANQQNEAFKGKKETKAIISTNLIVTKYIYLQQQQQQRQQQ